MKRLFISIPIEEKWGKVFEDYRAPMGELDWLRWDPLLKLHVTVLFLGATDDELIPEIEDALADIAAAQKPFALTLEKITYAPEKERANIVWARWKDQPEFATLSARTREELSYIVGKVDSMPAKPHTTLARFNKKVKSPKELIHLKHTEHEGETMDVKEILLMESAMTASGSIFKVLSIHKLGESAEPFEVVS